jgi:hypothetical protein
MSAPSRRPEIRRRRARKEKISQQRRTRALLANDLVDAMSIVTVRSGLNRQDYRFRSCQFGRRSAAIGPHFVHTISAGEQPPHPTLKFESNHRHDRLSVDQQ